jgi:hypothetical protein
MKTDKKLTKRKYSIRIKEENPFGVLWSRWQVYNAYNKLDTLDQFAKHYWGDQGVTYELEYTPWNRVAFTTDAFEDRVSFTFSSEWGEWGTSYREVEIREGIWCHPSAVGTFKRVYPNSKINS